MKRYFILILSFFLQFACSNESLELCNQYKSNYQIAYLNNDFEGCLFADSTGKMVLFSKDTFNFIQLHPQNGNYAEPVSIQKEGNVWKCIFIPIHNIKVNRVTGERGTPGEFYHLSAGGKTYRFSVADSGKIRDANLKLLRPDWQNVEPDNSLINDSHSSIERSTYELAVGGINLVVYPYKKKDSLYLNLRLINHSNKTLILFPPEKISSGMILSEADSVLIRAGARFAGKFSFYSDQKEITLIDNNIFNIHKNKQLIPLLKNDIPLVIDQSDSF